MCRQAHCFSKHTIIPHLCWASVLNATGQAALQVTQVKGTRKDTQPAAGQVLPGSPRPSDHPATPFALLRLASWAQRSGSKRFSWLVNRTYFEGWEAELPLLPSPLCCLLQSNCCSPKPAHSPFIDSFTPSRWRTKATFASWGAQRPTSRSHTQRYLLEDGGPADSKSKPKTGCWAESRSDTVLWSWYFFSTLPSKMPWMEVPSKPS